MLSFYVRANLHAALLHLREQNEAVHVWVNAICINQSDPDEKATQMSRIRYICLQASSVYIWFGEGDSDNKIAFDFLHYILDPGCLNKLLAEPLLTARKWRLILDLMHNPRFSRRWTLQEIVFAEGPIVVCGNEILNGRTFRMLFHSSWQILSTLNGRALTLMTKPADILVTLATWQQA
jgi:hypothetical protein